MARHSPRPHGFIASLFHRQASAIVFHGGDGITYRVTCQSDYGTLTIGRIIDMTAHNENGDHIDVAPGLIATRLLRAMEARMIDNPGLERMDAIRQRLIRQKLEAQKLVPKSVI